jgi:Predicted nucleotidyltransferases
MHMKFSLFINDFSAWACSRPDILAAALVGSQARGTAGPDSDVDLVILARDPRVYLDETIWAGRFGEIESQQVEDYGRLRSLRVQYRGGLEVEYGFAGESWAALPLDEGTRRVVADGLRILFEREPILTGCLTLVRREANHR